MSTTENQLENDELRENRSVQTEKIKESFNFNNAKRIFLKDWKEIRGNKDLFLPMLIVPIMFSILLPLLLGIGAITDPESFFPGATTYSALSYIVNMIFKGLFLMVPTVVSMIIASDSIAGEKERKTAETLLVLPITHRELYLGKVMAALIPAVLFSVIAFVIMGVELNLIAISSIPRGAPLMVFGDLSFWLVAFVLGTLFSFMNVEAGIIISARSKNMKSAQSISGVFIVPVLGLILGGIANPILLSNIWSILLISLGFAVVDYILQKIGSKVINREKLIANIG